jgi:hypothetical protein
MCGQVTKVGPVVTRDVFSFRSSTGHVLQHTTMLTSFPAPVFAHPPIWNTRPGNVRVARGDRAVLDCSATVGQQYNTVSMEPVHAAWTR